VAFPATPLPVVVQWYINDAWTAVQTNDVFGEDRATITITQGRTDETRPVDAARCEMLWRNTDGQFAPRNPTGDFYGLFGRNTPVRVGVTADDSWLQWEGPDQGSVGDTPAAGARVTAPDSAGLSITGDIDLRFDADLTSWHPDVAVDLLGKWTATAGQKSYEFVLQANGFLGMYWSNDGTTEHGLRSNIPVPVPTGRLAVRATLDVDNGAAGHTVRFYTSDSINGTWTQLGSAQTDPGTTSIFNSTTVATVGDTATGSQSTVIRGRVYGAKILDGIGGTERGNPDFTAQTAGASSFADAAGNTWTLTGAVTLMDLDLAFTGEIPSWEPRVDKSGNDEWVPVSAAGPLQRLSAGDDIVFSSLRRGILARDEVKAYWPCEDGSDSVRFASGIPDGKPMTFQGTPTLASSTQFVCSAPLPGLSGSRWTGPVRPYINSGELMFQFLMYLPTGTPTNSVIMRLNAGGARWDITYTTTSGGCLRLSWYDSDGVLIDQTGEIAYAVNDKTLWVQLDLETVFPDIDYALSTLEVGETTGLSLSGTAISTDSRSAQSVRVNPNGTITGSDAIIGHVTIRDGILSLYDLGSQLVAYRGETAGARLARLCEENGVQFTWYGSLTDTERMGPQGQATLLTLLREAADTDLGILHEPLDREGIAYRTRVSLYTQTAKAELNYTDSDPSAYDPSEDTVALVNEVTVTRGSAGISATGSFATATLESGALSILPPPNGVGPGYATEVTANVDADAQLDDQANWHLHLGTVDLPRVETLMVQLQRTSSFATEAARAVVRRIGIGDVVTVSNPPTSLGAPDDLPQVVQGWTARLSQFTHEITFRVSPAAPYDILVWDDAASFYTSDGTTTTEPLDTTETGVDVTTPTGPKWTDADGDYDIIIGGEVMTVTAVSGTGAAQTFTVTRSVNGVVKSHASGAVVELAVPHYWGL
jgi:hypothetical protein